MNEEEKYLFDLQGYLIIENALPPETVQEMNAWLDAQAEGDPAWRGQTGNAHIPNPITWGPMFRDLMDHPRVLPILRDVLGDTMRLDHDYAIFLEPGHTGLELHGPNGKPFDPCHYYIYRDGQIYCGLTVATFALTDVPPGAGGLALIPGSHKSNFKLPVDIRRFQRPHPIVQQIPMKAGDCVIFPEALFHGTQPWKGPGIRRTLFFKYAPGNISWEKRNYLPVPHTPAVEALQAELNETQQILIDAPSARDLRKRLT